MFTWISNVVRNIASHDGHEEKLLLTDEQSHTIYERFGTMENNILVVAGRKEKETLARMIDTFERLYGQGYHFYPGTANFLSGNNSTGVTPVDYERSVLDHILISQKAALENYDVPPSILVFDKCIGLNDATYRKVITDNKEYRYSTMTIVNDINDIDVRLMTKMDIIILCKDRDKSKMKTRCRSIWERRFSKKVTFEQFHCCITTAVGPMKASVITADGMHMMKFGRNDSSLIDVCAFPNVKSEVKG